MVTIPKSITTVGFRFCSAFVTTSFPGSSLYLEKVPWLRLVTCLCIQIKSPFAFFTDPIIQFILGGICIKTMDNQFTEA